MKMATGLHVRPRLRMSGAKCPLLLNVSRQTQGKLYFLTTIMYVKVLLARLRKCDSGLVQKLHQTHAVRLAGSIMTLSSYSNRFLSCIYKLVMTVIILALPPWLLRPWKMHFFYPLYLPFMHYAHCNKSFVLFGFNFQRAARNTLSFIHWKFRRLSLRTEERYINISLICWSI